MKPGIKTTEFWATLVSMILTSLVALGMLKPGFGTDAVADSIAAVIVALINGGLATFYARHRYNKKKTNEAAEEEPANGDSKPTDSV